MTGYLFPLNPDLDLLGDPGKSYAGSRQSCAGFLTRRVPDIGENHNKWGNKA